MSQTFKPVYGSNNQSITFSGLDGLTNGSTVFSSAIDNTTNLYLDFLVGGKFKTNASGTSSTGTISVLVAASSDGGSDYPSNVNNCAVLMIVTANANSTSYVLNASSVAALFGGNAPSLFKIGITNNTGAALDNAGGNNGCWYQGVQDQGV
jgi:hypothetical protein